MNLAIVVILVLGIAASIAADYLWKRWMADRARDRANPGDSPHHRP